uniref:Transposase n=1 Tax=Steinernema glaseri TaxID=37863 RepID=A0A1I8AR01_9BILA
MTFTQWHLLVGKDQKKPIKIACLSEPSKADEDESEFGKFELFCGGRISGSKRKGGRNISDPATILFFGAFDRFGNTAIFTTNS